jgi:phenylacetate-CoA ligase
MVLHDWERKVIEDAFQCRVTNRYGCEEVSLIACECERHEGLHVNADGLYVEVLRLDGTPAAPGELGMVVVTDLANRAMPILRYQVGDMAVPSGRACTCGRGLPMLDRVEGRIADYVVTPRGELISGISLTENFAVMVPGVAQLQIVQEELDRFVFRIVRGPDFGAASLDTIRSLVAERFGPEVRYQCDYVSRIPQEPSGKYRFCTSKVKKPFSHGRG